MTESISKDVSSLQPTGVSSESNRQHFSPFRQVRFRDRRFWVPLLTAEACRTPFPSYLHDALDVAMPLGEVDGAELGRALPVLHVGAEDGARTLPLAPDDAAHGALREETAGPHWPLPPATAKPSFPPSLPGIER